MEIKWIGLLTLTAPALADAALRQTQPTNLPQQVVFMWPPAFTYVFTLVVLFMFALVGTIVEPELWEGSVGRGIEGSKER